MKRRDNTALIATSAVGIAHFVTICALACIVIREQHSEVAAEYWQYASLFDVPVNLVLFVLTPLLQMLAGVSA